MFGRRKKMLISMLAGCLSIGFIILLQGCVDPAILSGDTALKEVTITGPNKVAPGSTTYFGLVATFEDGSTYNMVSGSVWTVTSGPGKVQAPGIYGAPATVTVNTDVTIHVSFTQNGITREASKTFTIVVSGTTTQPTDPPAELTLTALTITGPDTLAQGDTVTFTASATWSDNTTTDVTREAAWSVTSTLSDSGTIEAGAYTAPALVAAETPLTISANLATQKAEKPVKVVAMGVKKISGQVYNTSNAAASGVTMTCIGGTTNLTATTDSSGYYSFRVPYNWSGTITPQSTVYSFAPASRSYEKVVADTLSQNFTAGASTGENHAPVANAQTLSTSANTPINMILAGSDIDNDPLTFAIVTQPVNGTLAGTAPNLTYTPKTGFSGTDTFTFKVSDGKAESQPATVTIQVAGSTSEVTNVLYVDNKISSSSSTQYNPATRSTSGGTARVYKTLAGAAAVAMPGETVLIRGGSFTEKLVPGRSGTTGQYITYKNYNGETVTITGTSLVPAIDISNRSYIVIEGLNIDNVQRWLYAISTSNSILRNNHFSRTTDAYNSSKTGLFFQEATYNKILNNTIESSTQDSLALIKSDRNLIEGNTFTKAVHTLWTIKGGNYNVLRNNYFSNPDQKIGEVYDMDAVGDNHQFTGVKCTHYNLIEGNTFAQTLYADRPHRYNGIQYGGQNGIIRKNVFYNNAGCGLGLQIYSPESLYNLDNRVFNNVFYNNNFGGVYISAGSAANLSGNIFKNNIHYKNYGVTGPQTQLLFYSASGFVYENNNMLYSLGGEKVINFNSQLKTLNEAQSTWPGLFKSNIGIDPGFVDATNHDFRLRADSPMVNKATYLTRTVGASSGTTIKVQDVGYFYDGFNIPGERGDFIQLEGQTASACIVKIDYVNKTLTLDTPMTWTDGQGVSFRYTSSAPDMGAFEYGQN
jgi:parallel beta-helix repeat protein